MKPIMLDYDNEKTIINLEEVIEVRLGKIYQRDMWGKITGSIYRLVIDFKSGDHSWIWYKSREEARREQRRIFEMMVEG